MGSLKQQLSKYVGDGSLKESNSVGAVSKKVPSPLMFFFLELPLDYSLRKFSRAI